MKTAVYQDQAMPIEATLTALGKAAVVFDAALRRLTDPTHSGQVPDDAWETCKDATHALMAAAKAHGKAMEDRA